MQIIVNYKNNFYGIKYTIIYDYMHIYNFNCFFIPVRLLWTFRWFVLPK